MEKDLNKLERTVKKDLEKSQERVERDTERRMGKPQYQKMKKREAMKAMIAQQQTRDNEIMRSLDMQIEMSEEGSEAEQKLLKRRAKLINTFGGR
jgi:hypothetical protein